MSFYQACIMKSYLFYRDEMIYVIDLLGDDDAIANAECNPGTRRVEDMKGVQVWPEKPKAVP